MGGTFLIVDPLVSQKYFLTYLERSSMTISPTPQKEKSKIARKVLIMSNSRKRKYGKYSLLYLRLLTSYTKIGKKLEISDLKISSTTKKSNSESPVNSLILDNSLTLKNSYLKKKMPTWLLKSYTISSWAEYNRIPHEMQSNISSRHNHGQQA